MLVDRIKVLGIAASPYKGGNTELALKEGLKAAEETGFADTEFVSTAGWKIHD